MTTQTNELHADILIRAIVKDATGYMETIDKEDLPCNEQHKRNPTKRWNCSGAGRTQSKMTPSLTLPG
jgi:hypothetical protein